MTMLNLGDLNTFSGAQVVSSEIMQETSLEPVKTHIINRKRLFSYHLRIQKKWAKRYGWKRKPVFYMVQGKIFTHPNNIKYFEAINNPLTHK